MIIEILIFIESFWKELIATFVAFFSLWKYFDSRKKELDWKKTEFLFEQSKYIDSESDIQYVVGIIDGEHGIRLEERLTQKGKLIGDDEQFREGLHKLLNMLERLSYAVESIGSITMNEVSHFGWYFTSVYREELLVNYCNRNGYKQVVLLAEKVEEYFKS